MNELPYSVARNIRNTAFLEVIAEIMRNDNMNAYQREEAINCVLKAAGYAMAEAE